MYFEHHILLWKDPAVQIELHPLKGAFKRMLAGMPFLLTGARGPGRIAFSRDGAGHVFALHLRPGVAVDVREHQWLAATNNGGIQLHAGAGRGEHFGSGGTGFFIDTFYVSVAARGFYSGCTGYGNVFEVTLAPGEAIDIEPGGWIYKERTVTMQTMLQKLSTGLVRERGTALLEPIHGAGKDCAAAIHVLPHGRRRMTRNSTTLANCIKH